jgi:hypothetical protein
LILFNIKKKYEQLLSDNRNDNSPNFSNNKPNYSLENCFIQSDIFHSRAKKLYYANGNELLITSALALYVIDFKDSRGKFAYDKFGQNAGINIKIAIVLDESI